MSELIRQVSFDTRDLPASQRFEAWRALLSPAYDVTTEQTDFHARVTSANLGKMIVREISAAPETVARTPRQIRKDQMDHIVLCLVTDAFDLDAGSGMVRAPAGSVVVSAFGRPHTRGAAAEHRSRFASLSRDLVAAVLPDPEAHHGRVLTGGFARLLTGHVDMLVENATSLTVSEADGVGSATAHLLAAGLGPRARSAERARQSGDAAIALRCKSIIDQHLRSPSLTPEMICRSAGVSRTTLYRVFAREGGVSNHIRERRLQAARAAIASAAPAVRVSDVAYGFGFTNISSFNRAFRSAFGMSPSEAADVPYLGPAQNRVLTDWLDLIL